MACAHNAEWTCAVCEDAAHAAAHPRLVEGCTACRLSSLQFGAGTGVTVGNAPPARANPAWERGIAGEHRPGGGFMPIIRSDLSPMHVKEASERSHDIADARRRLANDPAPTG